MITHSEIWFAIDRLAEKTGRSPSGLAVEAGLDATSFNRSKRVSGSGKDRWPSTESVSKILSVVGVSFEDFATLAQGTHAQGAAVPLIGLAQAGENGYFDDSGFPVGSGWEEVRVPGTGFDGVYALQIAGDSMAPVFRAGDKVLVDPSQTPRRGDRVVVKTMDGEIMAKELHRITAHKIELISLNPDYDDRELRRKDVQWVARIVWCSQ
ncbi:helix-turn-helix transcriptional regulator [Fretibacter rubidus]|uniref:S24 family peptidase n=1 Tax=Fretibacter rubidus TaxID=570162 RepID=UPI00352A67C9